MSDFSVSIRLNLRPQTAGPVIDALAPAFKEAGLSFRSDAPGLTEGRGIDPAGLAILLQHIASVASDSSAADAVEAGVLDDLWVHIRRER